MLKEHNISFHYLEFPAGHFSPSNCNQDTRFATATECILQQYRDARLHYPSHDVTLTSRSSSSVLRLLGCIPFPRDPRHRSPCTIPV